MGIILANSTYLTAELRFDQGDLVINDGGQIESIQPPHTATIAGWDYMDCHDYLLLPGLVNAHFHSHSPLFRGLMRDSKLEEWEGESTQGRLQTHLFHFLDAEATPEELHLLCLQDYCDLLHTGVTFCADSCTAVRPPLWSVQAMQQVGLRGIVDAYDEYPILRSQPLPPGYGLAAHLPEEEDMTEAALATAQSIRQRYDPIMMTHALETPWRLQKVLADWGQSSVALLADRGLLGPKTVLFHGVYMSEADIDLVHTHGTSIIHCPISNLSDGAIAPVDVWLRKGVNVALGTDWGRTDLWDAMRFAYYLLKRQGGIGTGSAEYILQTATQNGVHAFGLAHQVGMIATGYDADLILLPKRATCFQPWLDVGAFSTQVHNLVMGGNSSLVAHVMICGRWIIQNGKLLTVDEAALTAQYQSIVDKLWRRFTV
ncbi:MAG: amidohydrolase family protein [Caldilineaceae bacterium]